ncbi:MAG: diphthine--ammonia ligase [Methanolinea sp.]|nr:diphthine--ammonia ligase [Methanolinea sp.]
MRLGVLCSGGKDSLYACMRAMQEEEVSCLITVLPDNPESFMFHTPNVALVRLQAEAAGIPLVACRSHGREEEELGDLSRAIATARDRYGIEGVVTGALRSVYQASRVQRVCMDLDLWCFNPLWHVDPALYMERLVSSGFHVIVSAVGSEPFGAEWLGRELDAAAVRDLAAYGEKYGISLTGEGGEYETLVLDAPFFHRKIVVEEAEAEWKNYRGIYRVTRARLEGK